MLNITCDIMLMPNYYRWFKERLDNELRKIIIYQSYKDDVPCAIKNIKWTVDDKEIVHLSFDLDCDRNYVEMIMATKFKISVMKKFAEVLDVYNINIKDAQETNN